MKQEYVVVYQMDKSKKKLLNHIEIADPKLIIHGDICSIRYKRFKYIDMHVYRPEYHKENGFYKVPDDSWNCVNLISSNVTATLLKINGVNYTPNYVVEHFDEISAKLNNATNQYILDRLQG